MKDRGGGGEEEKIEPEIKSTKKRKERSDGARISEKWKENSAKLGAILVKECFS